MRTETWVEDAANDEVSEEELRHALLAAAERMARSEAGESEIPWLDVAGVADVLQVDLGRAEAELVMMEIEGLVTPRAATFGQGPQQGALRIAPAGIVLLRSLRIGGGGTASEPANDAVSDDAETADS